MYVKEDMSVEEDMKIVYNYQLKYVIEDMSVKEDMKIVYNYQCKVCNRRYERKRRHENCLEFYTCDECELTEHLLLFCCGLPFHFKMEICSNQASLLFSAAVLATDPTRLEVVPLHPLWPPTCRQ